MGGDDPNDPDSATAYRIGEAYVAALADGDLARCRAIRAEWAGWPGLIRYPDELLDATIEWGEDLG